MKLLVLADAEAWHTERYVTELRREGHEVYLFSLQAGKLVDFRLPSTKYGAALSHMSHVRRIKELIDKLQPDVINSHFASAYGVMAARCRRRFGDCGALWALTVWGSDMLVSPNKSYLHRRRVQYALASADIVVADSTFLAEETERLTDTPVKTILWGIEREYVATDDELMQKAHSIVAGRQGAPLRIFAPRPHRALYDNITLLTSFAPMLKYGQVTMTVNSTGELYESFIRRAKELGVKDSVTAYQPCSRDKYIALLRQHDFYLSAATSDSSPVSLIEAMAVGVFPICADYPGLNDLLVGEQRQFSIYDVDKGIQPETLVASVSKLEAGKRLELLRAQRDTVTKLALYEDNIRATVRLFEEGYGGSRKRRCES